MVNVSNTAATKIKELMKEQGQENASLRIIVAGMGCSGPQYMMTLESEANQEDTVVKADGLSILVDPETAPVLQGAEIDYVETLERSGFTITNPTFQMSEGGGCGNCSCGHGGHGH